MREEVPVFLARWLAVQHAGVTGEEDPPTVDSSPEQITVGPLRFRTDEAFDGWCAFVRNCYLLFGPDCGEEIVLRLYDFNGVTRTMLDEVEF
jgi:hypothetical protein